MQEILLEGAHFMHLGHLFIGASQTCHIAIWRNVVKVSWVILCKLFPTLHVWKSLWEIPDSLHFNLKFSEESFRVQRFFFQHLSELFLNLLFFPFRLFVKSFFASSVMKKFCGEEMSIKFHFWKRTKEKVFWRLFLDKRKWDFSSQV